MANFLKYLKWLRHRNDEIELQNLAVGLNSSVNIEENIHILMLDYDIKDLGRVKESVRECQEFWNLADAYIYKTNVQVHLQVLLSQDAQGCRKAQGSRHQTSSPRARDAGTKWRRMGPGGNEAKGA
jgi:hypothetical protein